MKTVPYMADLKLQLQQFPVNERIFYL